MAQNAVLKIETLKGSSTVVKDAIEIMSYSFGVTQSRSLSSAAGARNAGQCNVQDVHITKALDITSPEIFMHCCDGTTFPTAELILMKSVHGSNAEYFKYKLNVVTVSSYQIGGADENPIESISLIFEKMEFGFAAEKADKKGMEGFVWKKWDVAKNKTF